MRKRYSDDVWFFTGFMVSLVAHLAGAVIVVAVLESADAGAMTAPEVFTVTLEGGSKLGGISQAPRYLEQKEKVVPAVPKADEPPEAAEPEAVESKKLEQPTVVEDRAEKLLEEKKKKAQERKKKEAEKKKKAEEAKRKKEEAEKRKKAEAERQKRERAERDRKLKEAISRAGKRYEGESADAGGQGFGAARIGGQGMGGGRLASIEFIAYRNELERHIKSGWHTVPGSKRLRAQVLITISATGAVTSARVMKSSGRDDFDDSVLRAVYKASPVPPAPAKLYDRFREVRITFDSHD